MKTRKRATVNPDDSPTAWFAMLEVARDEDDYIRAAEANRQLKRLGVFVTFRGRAGKKLAEAERRRSRMTLLGGAG